MGRLNILLLALVIFCAMLVVEQQSPTAHREAETAKAHRG